MASSAVRSIILFCFAAFLALFAPAAGVAAEPLAGDAGISPSAVTQFHAAIAAGKLEDVRAMLARAPGLGSAQLPNDDETLRYTPLVSAIIADQPQMVDLLTMNGVSADELFMGGTAMMRAAMEGHIDVIEALLDDGADINGIADANDLASVTPIRAAELYGHGDAAQFLLEKGARMDLFSAAGLGWKTYVADRIRRNPALATLQDKWGNQPIWLAVNTGRTDAVALLHSHGGSYKGEYGQQHFTALHIAAARGFQDLIRLLLQDGADVNAPDGAGKTPLAYALENKQDATASLLRTFGAQQ